MTIAVGSMWRDSAAYLDRAVDQCERLAKEIDARGDSVQFLWVENDSTDGTYRRLNDANVDKVIHQFSDGCPYFPSLDLPDRWRHLAWVANGVLEMVGPDVDRFVYVESDLAWEPSTLLTLLDHLDTVDVVSALNMRADGSLYDVWGHRGLDGRRFTAQPPHHPDLLTGDLVKVQSAAGCTAMTGEVARTTRFDPADCYVGWNRNMRLAGYTVWLDPNLSVVHA